MKSCFIYQTSGLPITGDVRAEIAGDGLPFFGLNGVGCGQLFQDQHCLIRDIIPITPDDLVHPPVHIHYFYFDL